MVNKEYTFLRGEVMKILLFVFFLIFNTFGFSDDTHYNVQSGFAKEIQQEEKLWNTYRCSYLYDCTEQSFEYRLKVPSVALAITALVTVATFLRTPEWKLRVALASLFPLTGFLIHKGSNNCQNVCDSLNELKALQQSR